MSGVVYRIQGDQYTLFYLASNTAKGIVLSRDQIGPKEEGLSDVFRGEMARNPSYLEEWVATLTKPTSNIPEAKLSQP